MGVAGKNSPTARRNATDLKALLPLITTNRRTKIFAYGFVVTFIICTAFLAFSPSTNVFSSLCTSSFQVSNLVLYLFPNSSSSALPEIQNPVQKPQLQARSSGNEVWSSGNEVGSSLNEVRSSGNEVLGSGLDGDRAKKGSSDGFRSEKNETGSEIDMHRGSVENETVKAIGHKNDEVLVGKNQTGIQETRTPARKNQTVEGIGLPENGVPAKNQTGSQETRIPEVKNQTAEGAGSPENGVPAKNQTGSQETRIPEVKNQTVEGAGSPENGVPAKNQAGSQETRIPEVKNQTVEGAGSPENGISAMVPTPKIEVLKGNKTAEGVTKSMSPAAAPSPAVVAYSNSAAPALGNGGRKSGNSIDKLMGCDIFDGRWVHDDSYPLYPAGSCPHIDEPFDCHRNGRPDQAFLKYRWQPNGCNIPRMNATDMLERLRGKRLVFVGDSLNRNMWESLVCVLANSVKDKSKVFEASGKREFRTEGAYSFVFKDYGCSVEFFRSPFLVREWEMPDKNGSKRETLRLDVIDKSTSRYKDAYAIIFNTGHWWTHEKTSQGKDYYQEGNHVYNVLNVDDAFHKALSTWARWVDANVNPKRTHVFFRGYSASHFSGGQWNSGGQCDRETDPIENDNYLARYPQKMNILEEVIKGMKTPVAYMNITRMTDYRKDGHPSFYRKPNTTPEERAPDKIQDCSHWCLPGVPDAWNELLYAQLLIKQHRMQH